MGLFSSDAGDVRDAVEKWVPGDVTTEVQCRNSLETFLRQRFGDDAKVIREYGSGRLRADLYLERRVGLFGGKHRAYFEFKYDLKSRSKLQRLIGQLHQYIDEKNLPCYVVLCGTCDVEAVRELETFIRKQNDSLGELADDDQQIFLVVKGE